MQKNNDNESQVDPMMVGPMPLERNKINGDNVCEYLDKIRFFVFYDEPDDNTEHENEKDIFENSIGAQ